MKTPRFFLGAVVLFWGWQVQTLWIALCLAGLLEFARMMKERFEFKPSDFNKFIDISTVLLAGSVVVALTNEPEKAIFIILKWLPLVFFPVIAAQEFSTNGQIDIQSFFLAARKKGRIQFHETRKIDVSYIYSLFCILSSGMANTKGNLFYISIVLFFVWALFQERSGRSSFLVWAICILAVIILGYAGHKTIRRASMKINHWIMRYYADYYTANPFKSATALGEITKLKFSDKIILRVSFQDYAPGKTYLLHSATYNKFAGSNWYANFKFEPVEAKPGRTFWQVNPPVSNTRKMTAYLRLVKGKSVLSLPSGVIDISEMKAEVCEKNLMQVIRIESGPSLIKAVVSYTDELSYDAAPDEDDFLIPKKESAAIAGIAEKLGFENKSEQEILKTIKQYFLTGYAYSLDLKGKGKSETPLQNFLDQTKAGHCELFATATVLLLRQANIPARYATGYIVREYSRMENQMVVRLRDGHAWVKVFANGQWQNFDTTPPSFLLRDRENIRPSLIDDLFSFLGFKLSQLRHETGAKLMNEYGLWLTFPLGVILFLRLRKSNKIRRVKDSDKALEGKKIQYQASAFDKIEQMLSKKGFPRNPYETYGSWLQRIGHHFDALDMTGQIQPILLLHNRLRFSRSGLSLDEKTRFDNDVTSILKKISTL